VTCHSQRSTKLFRKRLNACVLADGGHFEHITWTRQSRLIWHNFVKIGYNWIKICNLSNMGTYNRCVKNRLKILNRLWKKMKNVTTSGGFIFDSHVEPARYPLLSLLLCSTNCTFVITDHQHCFRYTPAPSFSFTSSCAYHLISPNLRPHCLSRRLNALRPTCGVWMSIFLNR